LLPQAPVPRLQACVYLRLLATMLRVSDERARWIKRNVLPHEPALRSWLRLRAPYDLDIDDIVQETYARLASVESVDEVRDPKNYMFRAAHSIMASHVRHARIVPIRSVADLDYFGVATPEAGAEERLEFRAELDDLQATLALLPEPCRKAFAMRRVEGFSQRETAERLGVSEKTIEKYMTRAVKLLMDRYGRGGKSGSQASNAPRKSSTGNDK
jgi:RNA polymerase sigma-70 factor (ECF subfamily)